MNQKCIGIDIGGTTVKLGIFTTEGELLKKWEVFTRTDEGGKYILGDIADSIKEKSAEWDMPLSDFIGAGMGLPGPVEADGHIPFCVNLGWKEGNPQEELQALLGIPVKSGNDANVAALGEMWQGGGRGYKDMVMVTLGTGVGGGIIINGKAVHGFTGSAGEIGHMVLNRNETAICGCGKSGCVEQYCSATGIIRLTKQALAESDAPSPLRSMEKFMAKDVFDAAQQGDTIAQGVLDQVFEYMGEFIANICCVVNPEVIVFGGGVSRAGQPILDGVRKSFKKWGYHACQDTQFKLATLGNDAGAYGAFKLVAE